MYILSYIFFVLFLYEVRADSVQPRKINRIVPYPYSNTKAASQRDVPDSGGPSSGGNDIESFLGPGTKSEDYDTSEFSFIGGGPVKSTDALDTDFSAPNCWSDLSSGKLKWKQGHGKPNSKKLQYYFNTNNGPDDDYLVVMSRGKTSDTAIFESCSVYCKQSLTITLKYWVSQGAILEICQRRVFFDEGDPEDCQKLPAQNQPGPKTIIVKLNELSAIIIRASNFASDRGSVAIIDDVIVKYELCENTTPSPGGGRITNAPAPTPRGSSGGQDGESSATCQNAVCSFEEDLCSYRDIQLNNRAPSKFNIQKGRYRNLLTGVRDGPGGRKYATAYLLRGQTAGLESGPIDLEQDRIVQVFLYEATQGINTKICINDQFNCTSKTNGVVKKDERRWKPVSSPVPKGTKKIFLITENTGANEGAIGYSTLRLMALPENGDINAASASICMMKRSRAFST